MALTPGPWGLPKTYVHDPAPAKSTGGGGGGGSAGGGGGGGAVIPTVTIEKTETAISNEVQVVVTNPTTGSMQISWDKFPAAHGYRVFVYQKGAGGEITQSRFRDLPRGARDILWSSLAGSELGVPTFKNDWKITVVAKARRKVDIDGNGGASIQLPGSYVKSLLKDFGLATDDQLDLPSFAAFDADFPEEVERYIPSQGAIAGLINEVEVCALGYLKPEEDGKLGLYLLDPTKAPVETFEDIDYVKPAVRSRLQRATTFNQVVVGHDHNVIDGSFETTTVDVPEATYKWVQNDPFKISSILIGRSANNRMAQLYAAHMKQQQKQLPFSVRSKGFIVKLGDVVAVNKARGFTPDGTYTAEKWVAFSIGRDLQKATVDLLTLQPFSELEKVRAWAADSVASWGSASADEKETNGYWHDDSNMVDGTFKHSTWGPR